MGHITANTQVIKGDYFATVEFVAGGSVVFSSRLLLDSPLELGEVVESLTRLFTKLGYKL
jgi:hypothetical protein